MSFFKDESNTTSPPGYSPDYQPLNRYFYDHDHYQKKDDSRLGIVLLGMSLIIAALALAVAHKPSAAHTHQTPDLTPIGYALTASRGRQSFSANQADHAFGTGIKYGTADEPPETGASNHAFKQARTARPTDNFQKSKQSSPHPKNPRPLTAHHESMLVPPPPPTPYMVGDGLMPIFTSQPAAISRLGKPTWSESTANLESGENKISTSSRPEQKIQPMEQQACGIDQKIYRNREPEFWTGAAKTAVDRTKAEKYAAPVPGNEAKIEPAQLERIVPASHDSF